MKCLIQAWPTGLDPLATARALHDAMARLRLKESSAPLELMQAFYFPKYGRTMVDVHLAMVLIQELHTAVGLLAEARSTSRSWANREVFDVASKSDVEGTLRLRLRIAPSKAL